MSKIFHAAFTYFALVFGAKWGVIRVLAICAAGGLVSMVFEAQHFTQDRVEAFVDALKLFKIGYSWGGPLSLVMPYELQGMRQYGPLAGKQGTLVRLAIGLERVEDLIADLDQALRVLRA